MINNVIKFEPVFTKMSKEEIENKATKYFNLLEKGLIESKEGFYEYSIAIESKVIKLYDTYEEKKVDKNTFYEKKTIVKKKYNRKYTNIFSIKLKELAKQKGYNVVIKIVYDEQVENWFYDCTLENKEYFLKKYGYALEELYTFEEEKNKSSLFRRYKKELLKLERELIKLSVNDKEKELDELEMLYHDAYMSYLIINNKYEELKDKEQISNEMFTIDNSKQILKLKK